MRFANVFSYLLQVLRGESALLAPVATVVLVGGLELLDEGLLGAGQAEVVETIFAVVVFCYKIIHNEHDILFLPVQYATHTVE